MTKDKKQLVFQVILLQIERISSRLAIVSSQTNVSSYSCSLSAYLSQILIHWISYLRFGFPKTSRLEHMAEKSDWHHKS